MARLLLIDDDELLRELLAMRLEIEGHEVVAVDHGAAGIEALRRERFDLVVLDLMMPVMDGVRFMRLLNGEMAPPPVIVLSAAGRGDLERDMLAAGVGAVLRKPVDMQQLVARIGALTGS
jgi:DNA-binding response OmpR family regulator